MPLYVYIGRRVSIHGMRPRIGWYVSPRDLLGPAEDAEELGEAARAAARYLARPVLGITTACDLLGRPRVTRILFFCQSSDEPSPMPAWMIDAILLRRLIDVGALGPAGTSRVTRSGGIPALARRLRTRM